MSTTTRSPAVTRLTGVPYDAYVAIRDAPGNDGYRMAYHDGVLEIMSPAMRHDQGARRLVLLVFAYVAAFELECEPAGSTTFRKRLPGELRGKGKEPDESFYLRDEAVLVRNRDDIDLTLDPPPSLWIEVDQTRGSSAAKLPLYAGLGIPEVWRFRPRTRRLWFGRLAGNSYESIPESVALPGLTPAVVLELLAEAGTQGASGWDRWLRNVWFPEHRQELIARGAGRK